MYTIERALKDRFFFSMHATLAAIDFAAQLLQHDSPSKELVKAQSLLSMVQQVRGLYGCFCF